jgi:hypothetical protein
LRLASLMIMAPSPSRRTTVLTAFRTVADDLAAAAAAQRPDLATAFTDGGWVAVEIHDTLLTHDGVAFHAGDVTLARPAVARDLNDFIVYSARTASLTGLRHGEHFAFADDA